MSFIDPDEHFTILFLLLFACAVGLYGERRGWFRMISGALVTIMIGVLFTSSGLLPDGADPTVNVSVYNFAFDYLVPLSIPLLLFNASIKEIISKSGKLMVAFLIGSAGVFIAAILAGTLIDLEGETYKLAAVYAATYTGGSLNFIAVADTYDFMQSDLFATSIVVDNVVTIIYIILLFYLPGALQKKKFKADATPADRPETDRKLSRDQTVLHLGAVLVIAGGIVALAKWMAPEVQQIIGTELNLEMLLITILIVALANIFPNTLIKMEKIAFSLGMYMLFFFLAVIGATCNLQSLWQASDLVLLFAITILVVHLLFTLLAASLLKFSVKEVVIASAANIGGSTVAAPMAATFGVRNKITAAVLMGVLGNILGTFLGIAVGLILK